MTKEIFTLSGLASVFTGKRNSFKKVCALTALFAVITLQLNAQTNPPAQVLPYSQNFGALGAASTVYPAGWQGWAIAGSSGSTFRTNAPTLDALLLASSTAATTSGGIHNYSGKIGMLSSNSVDVAICFAISTTGLSNIKVNFDLMTIRNPYDGTGNTRINGVDLQYRLGTSGAFTAFTGLANGLYQNNTTSQTGAVTTPQNLISQSVTLPAACNNQTVVQLRLVQRDISGAGSRASFAIDNVVACAIVVPTISITGPTGSCTGQPAIYNATITNGGTTPIYQWKKNGVITGGNTPVISLSGLIASDQITCTLTSNASCATPNVLTSNTITIATVSSPPVISGATVTNTSCPGATNGAIDITVSGGTGPYTICWDTINLGNGTTFGVTFGNKTPAHPFFGTGSTFGYIVNGVEGRALTLSRGITYNFSVGTGAGHPFFISTSPTGGNSTTLVTNGQTGAPTGTGTVTFTPNNTHPSLLYYACSIHQFMGYNVNIQNGYCTEDLSNRPPGTYTVIVTDANGCTTSAQYTIGTNPSTLALNATVTDAACSEAHNGAIDLAVTGGTGPYTVCWDTTNAASGPTFEVAVNSSTPAFPYYPIGNGLDFYINGAEAPTLNLMKGITYSFDVFSPGHPFHISTNAIGGNSLNLVSSGQTGAPNDMGTITFTPNASHPSLLHYVCANHAYMGYNVNIVDGYCVEDPSNLAPGIYSVLVTDVNGCTITGQYTVGELPSTLSATATVNNVACNGEHNGAIDLSVTGGTGPYSVCWDTTNVGNNGTFEVTVGSETPAFAYYQQGNGRDFYIDGIEAPELSLVRGITYNFDVFSPGHLWHISTDNVGGNSGSLVNNGQTGAPNDLGTVTFTPNNSHPSQLYYVCANHPYMGYNISITDGYCVEDLSDLGPGTYSVIVRDANGCTFTTSFLVDEPQAVVVNASSNSPVCAGSNLELTSEGSGGTGSIDYEWSGPNGFTSTDQNPVITGASTLAGGDYTVTVTDDNGCSEQFTVSTAVIAAPFASAGSNASVCGGVPSYSLTAATASDYATLAWITSGDGSFDFASSQNPVYTFGSGDISSGSVTLTLTASGNSPCTDAQSSITVTVTPDISSLSVLPITGPTYACSGTIATVTGSAVAGTTTYLWDAPTGTTFNGSNPSVYSTASNSVSVTFGSPNGSGYNICVQASNSCSSTLRKCFFVRGMVSTPQPIVAANARTIECAGTSANYSIPAVAGASGYTWSITGNATVTPSGTSATVNFGASWAGGTLCVSALTPCFTSPTRCLTLTNVSAAPGTMTGPTSVCPGASATYSVPAVAGAATYNWTLPAGATGSSTSNSINVTFSAGYNGGNISVTITSICGIVSPIRTKTISRGTPLVPSSITGPAAGLCGQTAVFSCSSVAGATSYTWTVPSGAVINSGQNTTSINVTFGTLATASVCVVANNSCGSSTPRCITVKGSPTVSGTITYSPNPFCANANGVDFQVTPAFGTSGYNWVFPTGVTVIVPLGNEQIVNWGTAGGTVSVTAFNTCGNTTKTTSIVLGCRETGQGVTYTEGEVTVYPNPSHDKINVVISSEIKTNCTLSVLDLSGRLINAYPNEINKGENNFEIDLSKLAKGTYLLDVKSDHLNKQMRIVLE